MQMSVASGSFVSISADFDRSAECEGQTHGVQRCNGISLFPSS